MKREIKAIRYRMGMPLEYMKVIQNVTRRDEYRESMGNSMPVYIFSYSAYVSCLVLFWSRVHLLSLNFLSSCHAISTAVGKWGLKMLIIIVKIYILILMSEF